MTIVKRMLDNADDTLFGLAELTHSDNERRHFFGSMRLLRKSSAKLVESFQESLSGLELRRPDEFNFEDLSLLGDEAIDDDITVGRTASRIEHAAKSALWDLAIRLEKVPTEDNKRQSLQAFRPAEMAKAFQYAVGIAKVEAETKLILFKLFERQLLIEAPNYYLGLCMQLESEGYDNKVVSRRGANATSEPPFPDVVAPTPTYTVPQEFDALLSVQTAPTGAATAAGAGIVPRPAVVATGHGAAASCVTSLPAWTLTDPAALQRLSLIGQIIDETGMRWSPEELQVLKRLIAPLLKIALADGSFFSDQHHPARAVLGSMKGAADRSARVAQAESLLQDLGSRAVVPSRVDALTQEELQGFLVAQRQARTDAVSRLAQARESAHQQVRTVGSGRALPGGLVQFLTQIWLPMVSAINLRFGTDSVEWTRSTEFLDRLFAAARWTQGSRDPKISEDILGELGAELRQIAIPPNLVDKARGVLREALSSPLNKSQIVDLDTFELREVVRSTQPDVSPRCVGKPDKLAGDPPYVGDAAAWRVAVPVGRWFRVFDRAGNRTQWLSAEVLYPQSPDVVFVGFDTSVRVLVQRSDFLDDLLTGKAEAIDPADPQAAALHFLCSEHRMRKHLQIPTAPNSSERAPAHALAAAAA